MLWPSVSPPMSPKFNDALPADTTAENDTGNTGRPPTDAPGAHRGGYERRGRADRVVELVAGSVDDVEGVPQRSIEFDAFEFVEVADRFGVKVRDWHGDDVVATDHAWFG